MCMEMAPVARPGLSSAENTPRGRVLPVGPAASRSARVIQPPSQRVLRPREIDHRGQRSIRQAQPIHAGPLGVGDDALRQGL
jgi:hypothetical protein